MPKKTVDMPVIQPKTFTSADDISQAIAKLRARIHQVEELKKDGLPYRDALKVTAEYQIRDTLREIFGEQSREYLDHQTLKIKISTKSGVNETINLLQHLVVGLEESRLEMLGLRARPAPPEAIEQTRHDATRDDPEEESRVPPAGPQQAQPAAGHPPAKKDAKPKAVETPPSVHESAPPESAVPGPVVPEPLPAASTKLKLSAEVPMRRHDTPTREESAEPTPAQAVRSSSPQHSEARMPTNIHMAAPGARAEAGDVPTNHGDLRRRSSLNGQQDDETEVDLSHAVERLRKTCSAFHRVARQLRHRRDERPTLDVEDERDVLDLLRALLTIDFEHVDTEDWSPGYLDGAIQTDLRLKHEGIVVLAKKTKPGLNAKGLTHQLSVDIERYASNADCKMVFCFIYDPEGRIGNPRPLENELTVNGGNHRVEAFITPK